MIAFFRNKNLSPRKKNKRLLKMLENVKQQYVGCVKINAVLPNIF